MSGKGDPEQFEVIVIGAGQTGLAASWHLARRGIDHVVLERSERVGDQWRARYDSLRLYSPARYDGLPGMPFPLPKRSYPTGRQMADYLEAYASEQRLPVRTGVAVDGLEKRSSGRGGYVVGAGERAFEAPHVIVATGFFQRPKVPDFATELDPGIVQLHSSDYRNPSQLREGPVLVVGFSHSGADLAFEAARDHQTIVAGRSHGELPVSIDSKRGQFGWLVWRFLVSNVFTIDTPIGRRMAPHVRTGGAPLLRYRKGDLRTAGVEMIESRVEGVRDGKPVLADGRVLDVANVLWCTGFEPDHAWIRLPVFDADGWPLQRRGVVTTAPGLYFLGILFQYAFSSMLVLGAGRDAAHVVDRIAERLRRPETVSAGREHAAVGAGR
jgi:putative flavoprotein involved in K+ transport